MSQGLPPNGLFIQIDIEPYLRNSRLSDSDLGCSRRSVLGTLEPASAVTDTAATTKAVKASQVTSLLLTLGGLPTRSTSETSGTGSEFDCPHLVWAPSDIVYDSSQ